MKRIYNLIVILLSSCCFSEDTTFKLAKNLYENNLYDLAAVEFQRSFFYSDDSDKKNEFLLFSSFSYLNNNSYNNSQNILDSFSVNTENLRQLNYWKILSAETNIKAEYYDEALYYLDMITASSGPLKNYYYKRKSELLFIKEEYDQLSDFLNISPLEYTNFRNSFNKYISKKDKNPVLGGLLGIIPGLGYIYSGEYANAFRSLILNSLFIYGMKDTARKNQWGAFSIITFFELTWYSGSIYGGIDSAHRYNKKRKDQFLKSLKGSLYLDFDSNNNEIKPVFKLKIDY